MLPIEVLEHILQDLDWTSVKNWSLVTRTFRSLALPILFKNVTLSFEPDSRINDTRDSATSHTSQFFKFLLENADVASFIQRLSLDEKRSTRTDDTISDWQHNADNLIRFLPKLKKLNHLSIQSSFFSDWTSKNDDLRGGIMKLCLITQLQSLRLSFVRLQARELSELASIPKVVLFCIDATPDPARASAEVPAPSSLSPPSSVRLQDLTITAKNSDDHLSALWSIVKTAGSNLTSLRIYSSPYDNGPLPLEGIDLTRHPSLFSLAITVPLTSNDCIEEMASIFSQLRDTASSGSKIKYIEICCDVDLHSFPARETLNAWNWTSLDTTLSSNAFRYLERLEITVKKVIRSRTTWQRQRKYKDLEGMLVGLFRSRLPVVSEAASVIAGPPVEEDR